MQILIQCARILCAAGQIWVESALQKRGLMLPLTVLQIRHLAYLLKK